MYLESSFAVFHTSWMKLCIRMMLKNTWCPQAVHRKAQVPRRLDSLYGFFTATLLYTWLAVLSSIFAPYNEKAASICFLPHILAGRPVLSTPPVRMPLAFRLRQPNRGILRDLSHLQSIYHPLPGRFQKRPCSMCTPYRSFGPVLFRRDLWHHSFWELYRACLLCIKLRRRRILRRCRFLSA